MERLQKLWIRYGTGDHARYLPIHIMYENLGANFCSVPLNAHNLTGCDMTSKVGTKESARFGSTEEINFLRQSEEYLVKVISPTTRCTTFDELRFANYICKKASLINLPPTPSKAIYIAVSLSFKSKLVYITKQKAMQIHANSVG